MDVFWAFSACWSTPVRDIIQPYWNIQSDSIRAGEYEYAGYSVWHHCVHRFYAGEGLLHLQQQLGEIIRRYEKSNLHRLTIFLQYTLSLVQRLLLQRSPHDTVLISVDGVQRELDEDGWILYSLDATAMFASEHSHTSAQVHKQLLELCVCIAVVALLTLCLLGFACLFQFRSASKQAPDSVLRRRLRERRGGDSSPGCDPGLCC
jgi:hypothetical protein